MRIKLDFSDDCEEQPVLKPPTEVPNNSTSKCKKNIELQRYCEFSRSKSRSSQHRQMYCTLSLEKPKKAKKVHFDLERNVHFKYDSDVKKPPKQVYIEDLENSDGSDSPVLHNTLDSQKREGSNKDICGINDDVVFHPLANSTF